MPIQVTKAATGELQVRKCYLRFKSDNLRFDLDLRTQGQIDITIGFFILEILHISCYTRFGRRVAHHTVYLCVSVDQYMSSEIHVTHHTVYLCVSVDQYMSSDIHVAHHTVYLCVSVDLYLSSDIHVTHHTVYLCVSVDQYLSSYTEGGSAPSVLPSIQMLSQAAEDYPKKWDWLVVCARL